MLHRPTDATNHSSRSPISQVVTRMLSIKEALASDSLQPEVEPTEGYTPAYDVVAWRNIENHRTIVEVYKNSSGLYKYRYQTWVGWRDAGDEVAGHGWFEICPKVTAIRDSQLETRLDADRDAEDMGLDCIGEWQEA